MTCKTMTDNDAIYEAIMAHYERLITYNKRESLIVNKCLHAISGLFDVLWQHKIDLINCGAFDQLWESANQLMRVVEERVEITEARAISSEGMTKDINKALEEL